LNKLEVKDSEAQEYFAKHADDFQTKEKVTLEYLELDAQNLLREVALEAGALEKLYKEGLTQGRFGIPEERSAAHILVKLDKDANQKTQDAARARAQALLDRLNAGGDFAAIAKESSDDKGSGAQGGDLGRVQKGQMVKEFEDALFALTKEKPLSTLVKSEFGFHIIQLKEIHAGKQQSFDEVKGDLEKEAKASEVDSLYFKRSDEMVNLAYEHADELNTAAQAVGLKVQVLADVTRDISANKGIGQESKVVSAAFGEDVVSGENNSDLIEIGDKHIVIVRVREHMPSKPQTYSQVAEQVKSVFAKDKAQKLALGKGEAWLKQLKEGASLPALVVEEGLKVQEAKQIDRNNFSYEPDMISAVFSANRPKDSGDFLGVKLPTGVYAVVHLKKVEEKSFAKATDAEKQGLTRTLGMLNGSVEFEAMLSSMEQRAEIVIHEPSTSPTE